MSNRRSPSLTRRGWLALAAGLAAQAPARAASEPVVAVLGDSITAGYGLPAAQALPAQLARALAALGHPARVVAAGISGDTTADGLARVDTSLPPGTRLCIVALGGNDLLQGLDPRRMRANLTGIVQRLRARRIGVLLCGLSAPPVIGPGYARDFDAVFPAVARAEHVPLYPDLLAGVLGHRELIQADGVHPDAAGAAIIAHRLAPAVISALRRSAAR